MYLSAEFKNTWSYPPTSSPPLAFNGVHKNYFIIRGFRFSERWNCRLDAGWLAADVLKCHSTKSIFWEKEFQLGYGRITIIPTVCNYLPNVTANIPTTRSLCTQVPVNSQQWAKSQLATAVSRMSGQCTARCHVPSRAVTAWSRSFPRAIRSHCKVTHYAPRSSAVLRARTFAWRLRFGRSITRADFWFHGRISNKTGNVCRR